MDVLGLLVHHDADGHGEGGLEPAKEQKDSESNQKTASCLIHISICVLLC